MRVIVSRAFWCVLLSLFVCILHFTFSLGGEVVGKREMVPQLEAGKIGLMLMMNESRRKLGSFQICALCTCCGGGDKTYCLPSPCCYAINCNIPNRPFGYCSFAPKTCNCLACHL